MEPSFLCKVILHIIFSILGGGILHIWKKVYYNGLVNIDSKSIKEGEKLGSIDVYYNDKKIVSEDVLFSKNNIVRSKFKYESVLVIVVIAIIGLFIFKHY